MDGKLKGEMMELGKRKVWAMVLAGAAAGAVSGMFGAGGGMVLVPLLSLLVKLPEERLFPASVCIILPVCVVSVAVTAFSGGIAWKEALWYLPGSALGGAAAGLWGKKIPRSLLHRLLGILILWGGIRYLC